MDEGRKKLPHRTEPRQDERRRYPRAIVRLAVRLRFSSVESFLTAHAEDLSRGGIFIRIEQPGQGIARWEVGQDVRLSLDAGAGHVIEAVGRVRRVVQPGSAGAAGGLGIEFEDLEAFSAQLIDAIVLERLEAAPPRKQG
jgi:hypothetical protein